jgi:lipopolysaccharide biosynthesis glycosyltransferase
MKVAYSCNDYYIPQTGISIISLCENNKKADEIVIYLIGKDVSSENINILRTIVESYDREFVYMDFDSIAYDINISAIGRHIETIYAKVYFSRIPNLDKIIYFDSDTIIDGDLTPLWNINLDECYLGAVQTLCDSRIKNELGLNKESPFFNDGMAIINVDYCRKNNLIEKIHEVIKKYNGNPPVLSEGALNVVCQGHTTFISPRWNLTAGILYVGRRNLRYLDKILTEYNKFDIEVSCKFPVVIHYLNSLYGRPWNTPCMHPFKNKYETYKKMSPWRDNKLLYKSIPIRLRMLDFTIRVFGYKAVSKIRLLFC